MSQNEFRVGALAASPGTIVSGRLEVRPAKGIDDGTFLPITIVHGSAPGPVLGLVAGVHGSEYVPILALQRLRSDLDPKKLSGTIVMVHVANIPAFLGRTVYVSPGDGKNLNRVFPGNPEGTLSERIAHTLTEQVILRSNYFMDLHAGDGNEGLSPAYTAYYAEAGTPRVIAESRRMAEAFGLDTIVAFKGKLEPQRAIWCGSTAVVRGVPAIDVESGQLGRAEPIYIKLIVTGILSVLRELDMLEGEPSPTKHPLVIQDRAYVKTQTEGIWHPNPQLDAGTYVVKDTVLGVVTDFFGNPIVEVRAPQSGLLLILIETPPVQQDETLAVIANVRPGPWEAN
ncbi:MAG: succinylglutamate desuccinylase/aspartoacylase family protein [Myxococcales bacterium]|nr:succinylglutamate desuccinylase/aspartoacylase family protein [Myxococcales bacterium]